MDKTQSRDLNWGIRTDAEENEKYLYSVSSPKQRPASVAKKTSKNIFATFF